MDSWSDIRRKARACHQKALAKANGDRRAAALLKAAVENADLEVRYYPPGTTFGAEVLGSFEREPGLVNVARGQDPRDEAVVTAHEIGHSDLHHDPINEVTLKPGGLGGDPIQSGAGKVEGYSPRERKEVQADVFAAEFLCPADWLRDEYIVRGRKPAEVALELGVPESLVTNQLIRGLLLPPLREAPPAPPAAVYDLDESQRTAATWDGGPLLVDAGPGTGKTRTLIHRIGHLLGKGSTPGMFLALTFSNKAAEEMRERLSAMNPDAAIEMWVGTFHAFGLELITKWPSAVGRTGDVTVLDEAGSLELLENNLAKLPLRHFQNLYEPAYELVHVLRAISRCKDELISPAAYRAAAEEAFAAAEAAHDADATEAAEKALELAAIYQIYEDKLAETDSVERVPLRRRIPGCASVARAQLPVVRSGGADVPAVLGFNISATSFCSRAAMQGGSMAGAWQARRAEGGEVTLTVAPTLAAEAEAVRDKIERFRARGIAYADQAILARSHLTLARVTGILEQLGVPMLYLGDLFERTEIRDLLSLVGIGAEIGNVGLVRVAALPEYGVSRDDAIAAIRWARSNRLRIQEALTRSREMDGVSEAGKTGLARLGDQLRGLDNASPWGLLTAWLFERSDYLRPLLLAADAVAQQKLIAIYHLLKVCAEQLAMHDNSRKGFLARIRRIEALNQDTSYRLVASEAADMDAVRVLTIHGSKGLEFGAVHIPALATRYLPSSRQAVHCPPPPSLTQLAMQPGDHDAEEECLFFVGLSRARDFLSISRAEQYTAQKASPSKFYRRDRRRRRHVPASWVRRDLRPARAADAASAAPVLPRAGTRRLYEVSGALPLRGDRRPPWRARRSALYPVPPLRSPDRRLVGRTECLGHPGRRLRGARPSRRHLEDERPHRPRLRELLPRDCRGDGPADGGDDCRRARPIRSRRVARAGRRPRGCGHARPRRRHRPGRPRSAHPHRPAHQIRARQGDLRLPAPGRRSQIPRALDQRRNRLSPCRRDGARRAQKRR